MSWNLAGRSCLQKRTIAYREMGYSIQIAGSDPLLP